MKKYLALLMTLLVLLCLSAPLYALSEESVTAPDNPAPAVTVAPTDAPVIVEREVVQETDPGGIDLTQIVQALIGLLASLVTVYLLPWIKAKTSQRQYDLLMGAIGIGVNAAEGLYKSGNGSKKMAYVMEYLKRNGFKVDEAEIESMVYRILNQCKQEVSSDG